MDGNMLLITNTQRRQMLKSKHAHKTIEDKASCEGHRRRLTVSGKGQNYTVSLTLFRCSEAVNVNFSNTQRKKFVQGLYVK